MDNGLPLTETLWDHHTRLSRPIGLLVDNSEWLRFLTIQGKCRPAIWRALIEQWPGSLLGCSRHKDLAKTGMVAQLRVRSLNPHRNSVIAKPVHK